MSGRLAAGASDAELRVAVRPARRSRPREPTREIGTEGFGLYFPSSDCRHAGRTTTADDDGQKL